jgi:tetratricopeptide (TPR) repeat protein
LSQDERDPSAHVDEMHVSGGVGVLVQEPRPPYPRFASNLLDLGDAPFVGREDDMARLADRLADTGTGRVMVICGHSGVGKTMLAQYFARQYASRYPGGTFFMRVDGPGAPVDLARVGKEQLGLQAAPHDDIETQCHRTLAMLGHEPTLLIYDDVPGPAILDKWAPPPVRRFHVLVTSSCTDWEGRREVMLLQRLDAKASGELCDRIAGAVRISEEERRAIIEQAGGLPVELCAAASAVAKSTRRGRKRPIPTLHRDTESSFDRAWSLLDGDARLALRAAALFEPQRIPEPALLPLLEAAGMTREQAEDAVDACKDRSLLTADVRMHALMATFVRARTDPALPPSLVAAHARAFIDAATRVDENPGDLDAVRDLDAYPADFSLWRAWCPAEILASAYEMLARAWYHRGRFAEALDWALAEHEAGARALTAGTGEHQRLRRSLHTVGVCYSRQGDWEQARSWFERAVAEAEQGDVHGRVDHDSLGRSLHMVGMCYSQQGAWEQARPWFERAVAKKEQGDARGCVDHESLSRSLHQLGICYSRQGEWEQARLWFERAVTETEQGDVHGRVDHDSLGRSLHMVGACYSQQDAWEQARPWFERAVAEAEQGDVHGRVDHDSLGRSLHMVGACYSQQDAWEQARPWFERAIAEKAQGDVHGRVNHDSLGRSLYMLAQALCSPGQEQRASEFAERALSAARCGDIFGRVDNEFVEEIEHFLGLLRA